MTVSVRAFTRVRFGKTEYVNAHERSDHNSGYLIQEPKPVDMEAIRKRRAMLAEQKASKLQHRPPMLGKNAFKGSTFR